MSAAKQGKMSKRKQKKGLAISLYLTLFAVIAAAINFGANLVLLPSFGMMGAAWSTVVK